MAIFSIRNERFRMHDLNVSFEYLFVIVYLRRIQNSSDFCFLLKSQYYASQYLV